MGLIEVKCQGCDMLPYTSLLPFQGSLKKRSEQDIIDLASSLLQDGIKQPISVWHKPYDGGGGGEQAWHKAQPNYVLDGHRRIEAIQWIADNKDPTVLQDAYPVVIVVEETLEEAKKALLLMSTPRGRITSKGLAAFVADCPKIDVAQIGVKIKMPEVRATPVVVDDKATLRLRLPKDKVAEVVDVLKGVSFVEIL